MSVEEGSFLEGSYLFCLRMHGRQAWLTELPPSSESLCFIYRMWTLVEPHPCLTELEMPRETIYRKKAHRYQKFTFKIEGRRSVSCKKRVQNGTERTRSSHTEHWNATFFDAFLKQTWSSINKDNSSRKFDEWHAILHHESDFISDF